MKAFSNVFFHANFVLTKVTKKKELSALMQSFESVLLDVNVYLGHSFYL